MSHPTVQPTDSIIRFYFDEADQQIKIDCTDRSDEDHVHITDLMSAAVLNVMKNHKEEVNEEFSRLFDGIEKAGEAEEDFES